MFQIFGGKDTLFGNRPFICSCIALGTHLPMSSQALPKHFPSTRHTICSIFLRYFFDISSMFIGEISNNYRRTIEEQVCLMLCNCLVTAVLIRCNKLPGVVNCCPKLSSVVVKNKSNCLPDPKIIVFLHRKFYRI